MIHRFLILGLVLGVLGASLGVAQDANPDDQPLRLKKKKKPEEPGMVEPMKQPVPPEKGMEKQPGPMEQPKEPPVVDPVTPEENEKELFERIGKNMRKVEDRLLNKELTEATLQLEEDIIKDLDSLIKKTENDNNSGGGGGQDNKDNMGGEQGQNQPQGGQSQPGGGMGKSSRNKQSSGRQKGNQQAKNQPGQGGGQKNPSQPMTQGQNQPQPMGQGMGQGMGQNQPMGMGTGNTPGAGGNSNDPNLPPDRNADLYKDIWGHLPETVRAQMNAYAGKEEYMQKHRDLIKQYYRSLAEQGKK